MDTAKICGHNKKDEEVRINNIAIAYRVAASKYNWKYKAHTLVIT